MSEESSGRGSSRQKSAVKAINVRRLEAIKALRDFASVCPEETSGLAEAMAECLETEVDARGLRVRESGEEEE